MTKSRGIQKHRRPWLDYEIEAVEQLFPHVPTHELVTVLNRPEHQIISCASRLGIKKSASYLASPAARRLRRGDELGKAYRFTKGQTPPNKGLRRPGWAVGRMAETQFKVGAMSGAAQHNYKPIGSYRIVYGNLEVKVTDDPALYPAARWKPVARLAWETAHGPVPPNHFVIFRKGQHTTAPDEITVERLECVTRAENLRRNSYHHRYPKDVGLLIQMRGQLTRLINRKSREKQDSGRA